MLRISKLADYAVVVMACLATQTEPSANARALAACAHLGVATVSKVLKLLRQAGLVTAHRGISGGYTLAMSAETISLADIVIAIDGNIALTECGEISGACALENKCIAQRAWRTINQTVLDALRNISLVTMCTSR